MKKNRFKTRLILQNTQDSDAISGKRFSQKTIFKNYKKITLMIFPFFVFFPLFAYAGFFSLGVMFGDNNIQKKETPAEKPILNSQTISLLQAAINLDPDPAKGGADISIVEDKALVAESGLGGSFVELSEKKNSKIAVYEVKEGDTLSQIADMFQVSMNTIRWANDFSGEIQPGQKLVILPITGVKYTVKSGGTIDDIAKLYNADVREIALFNGIPENKKLEAGDEIIVPYAEKETPKITSSKKLTSTRSESVSSKSSWLKKPMSGYRSQGIHGHNAIDIAAPEGTPIYASASGQVLIVKGSGWNGGYGSYIVIEHSNGVQTLYAHLNENNVSVGQWVEQGETIGYSGNTGRSTGPHLHFEVRGGKNPF